MQDKNATPPAKNQNSLFTPLAAALLIMIGASTALLSGMIEGRGSHYVDIGLLIIAAGMILGLMSVERSRRMVYLPLLLLVLITGVFIKGLMNEKGVNHIPSNLIGKKIDFALEAMPELMTPSGEPVPTFQSRDLAKGQVSIVNVWASWCISCRAEHRYLEKLARISGAGLYGLNYKDAAADGLRFLKRFGNPYRAVGMDRRGRVGIDLGVYGVPETFILDGKGIIRYKFPGPINDIAIEKELLPAIAKARKTE